MRFILFVLIFIGMIFLFASIHSGVKQGATFTNKVILSVMAFLGLLILLLVAGASGLFG